MRKTKIYAHSASVVWLSVDLRPTSYGGRLTKNQSLRILDLQREYWKWQLDNNIYPIKGSGNDYYCGFSGAYTKANAKKVKVWLLSKGVIFE